MNVNSHKNLHNLLGNFNIFPRNSMSGKQSEKGYSLNIDWLILIIYAPVEINQKIPHIILQNPNTKHYLNETNSEFNFKINL